MTDRKTIKELRGSLVEVAELVPVGSLWRHYKGDIYKVTCLAFDEETLDFEVVYEPVDDGDIHFTRRLSLWLEIIQWQGAALPRFERLEAV